MSDFNVNQLLAVDDIPGLEDEVVAVEPIELKQIQSNPVERHEDLGDDYGVARNSVNIALQLAQELAISATETARNAESPRSIEVAANAINVLASMAEAQLKLHKSMKDITNEQAKVGSGGNTPQQQQISAQNVFFGTPAELMAQVGTQYDAQQEKIIEHEGK